MVFDDGVAYRLNWKPLYEFTLYQGEGVLFPPGWIHETLNLDPVCTSIQPLRRRLIRYQALSQLSSNTPLRLLTSVSTTAVHED